jgi:hypothetical protein
MKTKTILVVLIFCACGPLRSQQTVTTSPIQTTHPYNPTLPLWSVKQAPGATGPVWQFENQAGEVTCYVDANGIMTNGAGNGCPGPGAPANALVVNAAGPPFNAPGDGTHNASSAVQSAMSFACNGTALGVVGLPSGLTFLLSSIILPANCRLTGGGTVVYPASENSSIIVSSNDEIDHLTFNGAGNSGAAIIGSQSVSNIKVHDSTFENFANGSICFAAACGGYTVSPTYVRIYHNFFLDNEDGAMPPIFNVQFGDGCSWVSAEDNTSVGDGDYDFASDGCSNVDISRNWMLQGVNGFGGSIQVEATSADSSNVMVSENHVLDPHFADGYAAECIHMVTDGNGSGSPNYVLSNFAVVKNILAGCPSQGINVAYVTNDNAEGGTISGNQVYKAQLDGIEVSAGETLLSANLVRDTQAGPGILFACLTQPCTVTGNLSFDDQTTKTQTYGLVVNAGPWLPVFGSANVFYPNLDGNVLQGSEFYAGLSWIGSITTTSAASDSLSFAGATANSVCSAEPANSTAAALTGVYLTASAGSVTIFHSATAGGIFNLFCGLN